MRYGPFTIATVRPETKFRDTALAVNPNDPRYAQHLGKTFEIMGLLGPITMKIIGDEGVDPAFGTGIMKVTPAHDAHDFELGQRYNLPVTPIIDFTGKMDFRWYIDEPTNRPAGTPEQQTKWLERAQKYHGKKVAEARALMVEDLAADGLLLKTDTAYSHNVGTCYRCGNVLEPLPLPQFYIKTKPLTEPIVQALDAGEFVVAGAGHDKILRHWLTNLRDWNISRQIVWGIRLPVWYSVQEYPDMVATFREHTGESNEAATPRTDTVGALLAAGVTLETIAQGLQSLRAPANAHYIISPTSPGPEYLQETDTFDTWFSSSQWPFATLFVQAARAQTSSSKPTPLPYSPEEIAAQLRQSFSTHYPTTLMETGYDILPFWVMRMLMLGKYMTGKLPFTQVYLHGLVRDEKGAKMSKSKGNVINPLAVIDEFGADALRLALVIRSSAGLDKSVGVADFKAARNFTNKLWNAARFVLEKKTAPAGQAAPADANITARAQALVDEVTQQLQDLKIGLAADTLYNTFWHWFCDECIEQVKTGEVSVGAARTTLETFLKLLHPFVPFVTEAIWSELSSGGADSANNTSASTTPMPSASSLLISTEWPSTLHS
jgi:valyl-tRNA synthetase